MALRFFIGIVAFVLGAAAFFAVEQLVFPVQAAGGCSVAAAKPWTPLPGRAFRAEAFANGPACALAAVTLVIRAPDGKVLWADAAAAEHLMTFVEAKTRAQMTRALGEWLMQNHMFKSSAELPLWKTGADGPASGEFPFIPEPDYNQEAYEQARAAKLPMFCYVQGMESMACIVLSKDGQMTKIGVQTFPG